MIGRRSKPSADEAGKPKGFDDFELRLGDVLRGERATLSKSLLDVQRELRIKASYIAAIENCDIAAFDTPGFIAGYVRSYARYLGVDADWAFERFCKEANFTVAHGMSAAASGAVTTARRKKEYDDPFANPNASFVPRTESFFAGFEPRAFGSITVLIALISGIGYGGWSVLQEVQRVQLSPIDQAPGVEAELDPLTSAANAQQTDQSEEQVALLPGVDSQPDPEALSRLYRPQALDAPVLVPRDGPIASIDPRTVGVLSDPVPQVVASGPAVSASADTPIQVVAADAPAVELIAARPSWVRVQGADGTVLFEKILDAGEHYIIPPTDAPPVLRAGESGAIYFAVNGQTFGPAGDAGKVTKDIILTPSALTERYVAADPAADEDLARAIAVASVAPDGPVTDTSAVDGAPSLGAPSE